MASKDCKSKNLDVEMLTGKNWNSWSFRIKQLLTENDMEEFLEPMPAFHEVPEGNARDAEVTKWKKKDRKAFAILSRTVSDELINKIRDAASTKEAYETLKKMFEGKDSIDKLNLRQKLHTLKMDNGKEMHSQIGEFEDIIRRLTVTGAVVQDDEKVAALLNSLPPSYSDIRRLIETLGLDYNQAVTRILFEEKKMKEDCNSDVGSAFVVKKGVFGKREHFERKDENRRYPFAEKKSTCYNCGKSGHIAKDCWSKRREYNYYGLRDYKKYPERSNAGKYESSKAMMANTVRQEIKKEMMSVYSKNEDCWYLDSGCNQHMTPRKEWFNKFTPIEDKKVFLGNNEYIFAKGIGDITMEVKKSDGLYSSVVFTNVLWVPDLAISLLSVKKITSLGYKVIFFKNRCVVMRNGVVEACGNLYSDIYKIECKPCVAKVNFVTFKKVASFQLWHERFGHLNYNDLQRLSEENIVHGLNIKGDQDKKEVCEDCQMGKQRKLPFSKSKEERASELLQKVHSDVVGPIKIPSFSGSKYFVTFIDEASNKVWIYLLKRKDEVFTKFKEFVSEVENQTGRKIKILQTDNGSEYCSTEFSDYLKSKGIIHRRSAPYTPEQNGLAERMNRTIVESARSMLSHANLNQNYWGEAVNTATYIRNRCPSSGLDWKTPEEIWNGVKPTVNHLRKFGSIAYAHIPKEKRTKFDFKANRLIFVGYDSNSKAYRLLDPKTKRITISRHVVFDESKPFYSNPSKDKDEELIEMTSVKLFTGEDKFVDSYNVPEAVVVEPGNNTDVEDESSETRDQIESKDTEVSTKRHLEHPIHKEKRKKKKNPVSSELIIEGKRERIPNKNLYGGNYIIEEEGRAKVASTGNFRMDTPNSYQEAVNGPMKTEWIKAIEEEKNSLLKNNTWITVDNLPKRKIK
jgi:hypothetical protein